MESMMMGLAMGVIETTGIPAALAVADVMGKASAVEIVQIENTSQGWISVIIRGSTGDVQAAIAAAISSLQTQPGAQILGHHIIPCPDGRLDSVLPLRSTEQGTAPPWQEWLDD